MQGTSMSMRCDSAGFTYASSRHHDERTKQSQESGDQVRKLSRLGPYTSDHEFMDGPSHRPHIQSTSGQLQHAAEQRTTVKQASRATGLLLKGTRHHGTLNIGWTNDSPAAEEQVHTQRTTDERAKVAVWNSRCHHPVVARGRWQTIIQLLVDIAWSVANGVLLDSSANDLRAHIQP